MNSANEELQTPRIMNVSIEPLNCKSGSEEVKKWFQRFEALCILQEYDTDAMKTNAMISLMGREAFDLLVAAVAPKEPKEFKIEQIKEELLR